MSLVSCLLRGTPSKGVATAEVTSFHSSSTPLLIVLDLLNAMPALFAHLCHCQPLIPLLFPCPCQSLVNHSDGCRGVVQLQGPRLPHPPQHYHRDAPRTRAGCLPPHWLGVWSLLPHGHQLWWTAIPLQGLLAGLDTSFIALFTSCVINFLHYFIFFSGYVYSMYFFKCQSLVKIDFLYHLATPKL